MALLQKSMNLDYHPATYELAVLLSRHRDNTVRGKGMVLMRGLCNVGYEPAMVNLRKYNGTNRRVVQEVARQRLSSTRPMESVLSITEVGGPRIIVCSNQYCVRRSYEVNRPSCRKWLRKRDFSPSWKQIRREMFFNGTPSPYYSSRDRDGLGFVPRINNTCSRCRIPDYCSLACQHMDWPSHRETCIQQID